MDPAVRRFLPLIQVDAEPEYEALFPEKQPNSIRVETRDGTAHEEYVEYPIGHAKMPMEKEDLLVKFAALAAPELDRKEVEGIYELIDGFDTLESVARFFEAVRIR
jgi:2-methylcitrate dehydratase PrpD